MQRCLALVLRRNFHGTAAVAGKTPGKFDINLSKFSESVAFRRTKKKVETTNPYSNPYGSDTSHLGDFYDTFRFNTIQTHCIIWPLACFLIYFGVLREENDLDERMMRPMWMSVPALERDLVVQKIAMAKGKKQDYGDLEKRLVELDEQDNKLKDTPGAKKKFSFTPAIKIYDK